MENGSPSGRSERPTPPACPGMAGPEATSASAGALRPSRLTPCLCAVGFLVSWARIARKLAARLGGGLSVAGDLVAREVTPGHLLPREKRCGEMWRGCRVKPPPRGSVVSAVCDEAKNRIHVLRTLWEDPGGNLNPCHWMTLDQSHFLHA